TISQDSTNASNVQNNLSFPNGCNYRGIGAMTFSGALSGLGLAVTTNGTGNLTIGGGGIMGLLFVNGDTRVTAGVLNLTNLTGGTSLAVGSSSTTGSLHITGGAVVNAGVNVNGPNIIQGPDSVASVSGIGSKLAAGILYTGTFNESTPAYGALAVLEGGAVSGVEFNLTGSPAEEAYF